MDYKQPITSVPAEDQYVKQFNPSRKSPIYARAFRRYTCRESVAQTTDFRNLTFKIQQPNNNLVFNSVKLCLPLSLKCESKDGSDLSMRITNRLPACNIAVSQYPWKCFKHISLAVNGKVYSQNCSDYGYILGKCYSSKDKNGDHQVCFAWRNTGKCPKKEDDTCVYAHPQSAPPERQRHWEANWQEGGR